MISPESYPVPEEFIKMAERLFGSAEGKALVSALGGTESPVSVRLNPRKSVAEQIYEGMNPVPWCENGFYLPERPSFTVNPLLHAGAFYVQEAASMIHGWIVSQLGLRDSVIAVDLCAAPGGKTGVVIDALPVGSMMVANEFIAQRAQVLKENMAKQGAPDVIVTNSPVSEIGTLGAAFDLMIADVPCSGEGMMRKEEAARTQWSPRLTENCQSLQREILGDALPALKPGGWLIYSTCTFNTLENEDNVRWLVEEHGLENIPLAPPAEWNVTPAIADDICAMRFLPHKTKGDGLFVALLRKPVDFPVVIGNEAGKSLRSGTVGFSRKKDKGKVASVKNITVDPEIARKWINSAGMKLIGAPDGSVRAMSASAADLLTRLRERKVKVLSAGTEIGFTKGRDLAPSTELALSTYMNGNAFPSVDLTLDQALDYLRHETLRLDGCVPRGYAVVTYKGLPLGFVNNIGSRANNMYPTEWRIRNK